ncbi:cupin domain-containing protein [Propionicimonas sp.]|uniref:cupin domain-containing protein n=1 Tax=Propionicimonas sp. TaxID=1955623 RepID=UPI0039E5CAE3
MSRTALEFHTPDHEWSQTAPGTWVMVLSDDPESGERTLLQRYDAGFDDRSGPVLVHDFTEEVFVLEGELTDCRLGQTFVRGMYASRPPGMRHGPYRSEGGCLMFVTLGP